MTSAFFLSLCFSIQQLSKGTATKSPLLILTTRGKFIFYVLNTFLMVLCIEQPKPNSRIDTFCITVATFYAPSLYISVDLSFFFFKFCICPFLFFLQLSYSFFYFLFFLQDTFYYFICFVYCTVYTLDLSFSTPVRYAKTFSFFEFVNMECFPDLFLQHRSQKDKAASTCRKHQRFRTSSVRNAFGVFN